MRRKDFSCMGSKSAVLCVTSTMPLAMAVAAICKS